MSRDAQIAVGIGCPMRPPTDAELKEQIIERTREAREASGYTQEEIAGFLQITQGRYKQYETRTPLPHVFVMKFCLLTRVDVHWLLTGDGAPPKAPGKRLERPGARRGAR